MATSQKSESSKTETSFSYNFQSIKINDLIFNGDTHTSLLLTSTDDAGTPLPNSFGRVIYANTVSFSAATDFNTTIKFIINPSAAASTIADGLVFFMVPVGHTFPTNAQGGRLGIFEKSGDAKKVFAVEFDTFSNISWDPLSVPHVGIDIQSAKSTEFKQFSDSFIGKELTMNIQCTAGVDKSNILVSVTSGTSQPLEVKYDYNLASFLPPQVQVGLAAATGDDGVAIHEITSWDFSSKLNPDLKLIKNKLNKPTAA